MPNLFPISIEVEEVATGRVLRKLSAMEGVAKIHLNLTQEKNKDVEDSEEADHQSGNGIMPVNAMGKAKFRTDGRLNARGLPPSQNAAYRTIADILKHSPAHIKLLDAAIRRNGIGGIGAINGYIHRMTVKRFIKRTAPGTYRLTEHGEKIFFNKEPSGPVRRVLGGGLVPNNFSGVRHLLLTALREGAELSTAEVAKLMKEKGYSPKNLSTTGMKMRVAGLIRFVDGHYSITKAGKEVLANPPALPTPVFNIEEKEVTPNG